MTEDRARPVLWRWILAGLMTLIFGILAYMSLVILPKIQDLYGSVKVELPLLTLMALNLAAYVRDFWWMLVAMCLFLVGFGLSGRFDSVIRGMAITHAVGLAILTGLTVFLHLHLHTMAGSLAK